MLDPTSFTTPTTPSKCMVSGFCRAEDTTSGTWDDTWGCKNTDACTNETTCLNRVHGIADYCKNNVGEKICTKFTSTGRSRCVGHTIVLGSTSGAAEYVGNLLGEFVKQEREYNEHIFYKQRETEAEGGAFVYFEQNAWWVGPTLGGGGSRLKNELATDVPPTKGWQYSLQEGAGEWRNEDSTLSLGFTSLAPVCQLVRVEGDAKVKNSPMARVLGDYKIQDTRWSCGRPVYRLINSEREVSYLMVKKDAWYIHHSDHDRIASGRATNSPTDVDAAASVRLGLTRWTYIDGNDDWKEGNIDVKCLD